MMKKVLSLVLVAAIAIGVAPLLHRTYLWSQAVTRNQATIIASIDGLRISGEAAAEDVQATVALPVLGPESVEVGNFRVHTKPYRIPRDVEKVLAVSKVKPAGDWNPDLSQGLDAALPFPWPEKYVNDYKQPFNFWAFFRNAQMLCAHYDQTKSTETKAIMQAMYDRLLEYSELVDGQRFGMYNFELGYRRNSIAVEWPWTSAYASGAVLVGLSHLWECAQIEGALETAREFLNAMANPIDPREGRPRFWVSFVDERGYLWFEEKPLDQVDQPRILNGHIRALTGLYEFFARTRDPEALKLLRAGIRTVEEYAPYYRVPGNINAYDLLKPHVNDYGPERTIQQQAILYRMTGEPVFRVYQEIFEADMRVHIDKKKKR